MPYLTILFNLRLEVLIRTIRQELDMKAISMRKEKNKFCLCAEDMILYVCIYDPKDCRKKTIKTNK